MGIVKQLISGFKDEKKKRLIENYFSLSVLQGANYLLPLITLPYLVRVLGAEKFGLVMFAQAFMQYFIIFSDYGFNLSATREISVNRDNRQKVSEIYSSIMIIKTVIILLSFGILAFVVFFFTKFRDDWLFYFLAYGMVVGQAYFPIWFFQGMEKMKFITILNITAKVVFTVLVVAIVREPEDFIYVPFFTSLGYLVAAVSSLWIIFKRFKVSLMVPPIKIIYGYLKDSTQFFLSRVSVSFYTNSNTFVVGLVLGNTAAGFYSAAEKLFNAMVMLYKPLADTLYPFMSHKKDLRLYKKIFIVTSGFNLVFCALVFLFSGFIINLIYGDGFQLSAELLKIFSILCAILVPSVLLGYPLLAAMGYPRYANYSVIIASLVHLVILGIMIPFLNIYLVAILLIITQLIVILIRIYGIKKNLINGQGNTVCVE
ncbi:MAG: flippase [Candidatus Zixiibacteriota bacterium]